VTKWCSRGWRVTALVAALLVVGAAACGLAANALSSDPLPLWGREMGGGVGHLSLGQAVTAYADGAVFVDARAAEAYRAGHVAGALNAPFAQRDGALAGLRQRIPLGAPVVVYCTGPGCPDADRLAAWMTDRGWSAVDVFSDGFPAWEAAGQPEQSGLRTAPP